MPTDRHAREAGLAHDVKHLGEGGVVLHGGHVDAGHHDLVGHGVAEVDDLVDHALLLLGELLGVGDQVLDLVLGRAGVDVGVGDAKQLGEAPSGVRRERHERLRDDHERADRAGDRLGHALGVRQGDALGHELAHDDREVRHDEGDDDRCQRVRDAGIEAERSHPAAEGTGQAGCGERRCGEAHERDGNLDGGEEIARIGCEGERLPGALIALLGLRLEDGFLRGDDRQLGGGEETVCKGEQERDDERDDYVHARKRNLLGREQVNHIIVAVFPAHLQVIRHAVATRAYEKAAGLIAPAAFASAV